MDDVLAVIAIVACVSLGLLMLSTLNKIADFLVAIERSILMVNASLQTLGSLREALSSIGDRYELLTNAECEPLERDRRREMRRKLEAEWDWLEQQIRRGNKTKWDGGEIPRAPAELEIWLTAKRAENRAEAARLYPD